MGQLRFDWMRRRGDFMRPRSIPRDVWREMVKQHGVVGAMERASR